MRVPPACSGGALHYHGFYFTFFAIAVERRLLLYGGICLAANSLVAQIAALA